MANEITPDKVFSLTIMKALLGKKIGMTRVFDKQGLVLPVTIIEAGPCFVTQVKDGSVQLGFASKKHLNKPEKGHLKKSGASSRRLREFRIIEGEQYNAGDQVKADIFKENDIVEVSSISKGRGFAGTVKRHHFNTGPRTHGSDNYRRPGSIGCAFPQRVPKGKRMSGHLGAERVTVKNLRVIDVISEQNILVVRGCIPGPKNSLLEIRGLNG